MAQTVFDVGDPITSTLKLGVTPDGSTAVTLTVYRPDGTALSPGPTVGAFVGDLKTAQWYATDDGSAAGTTLLSAGDWLALWKVTGTGATVAPKVYNVTPLPGTSTRRAWSPFLSSVADWVPYLTVDTTTPGSQVYLGTFTGWTTPTDEVAQRHIDNAVTMVGSRLGTLPASFYPMARTVAALRAAVALARAFPRNRDDLSAADALERQAAFDLKELIAAVAADASSSATSTPAPVGIFPSPVAWGDLDL